jgi:hypothetical protein
VKSPNLSHRRRQRTTTLTLFREPTTGPDYRFAINKTLKEVVYRDFVAKLDVKKPGTQNPLYARSYAVRTGLSFAPEADAHCDDFPAGTRCFLDVARPGS